MRWVSALAVLGCSAASWLPAGEPPEPGETPEKAEDARPSSEREKAVLALFTASSKKFTKDGKIVLEYDFESKAEELVEDWRPTLDQAKPRIRWARGLEGTYTTIEHGILVGDYGEWVHRAVFLPDLEVKVETLSVAQFRPGTILAVTYYNAKKKQALGVTGGFQAVCLSQRKHAKPPFPKTEKPIPINQRHTVGFKLNGKVLESYLNNKKTSDTSTVPKFADGFDTGQVGFSWSGSVQSFLFKVTMEGRLDPDWVAKQLGDKPEKAEKSKKPAGAAGAK
jgi:hypothetical protein